MSRRHNHCSLSQEAIEWISGELLGDGCLYSRSKYSAQFKYSSKYLEYIQYIFQSLISFGITGRISKHLSEFTSNYVYRYTSHSYLELLPIQKQWYPEDEKIIPRNIKLTSLVCRQWYIGDGCLAQLKDNKAYIRLATNGFSILGVKWLIKKLIIIGFKTTRQLSRNTIRISEKSTKSFLDYVGKCPVKCYKYKWNY